jgi:HEAT repeat protein
MSNLSSIYDKSWRQPSEKELAEQAAKKIVETQQELVRFQAEQEHIRWLGLPTTQKFLAKLATLVEEKSEEIQRLAVVGGTDVTLRNLAVQQKTLNEVIKYAKTSSFK